MLTAAAPVPGPARPLVTPDVHSSSLYILMFRVDRQMRITLRAVARKGLTRKNWAARHAAFWSRGLEGKSRLSLACVFVVKRLKESGVASATLAENCLECCEEARALSLSLSFSLPLSFCPGRRKSMTPFPRNRFSSCSQRQRLVLADAMSAWPQPVFARQG